MWPKTTQWSEIAKKNECVIEKQVCFYPRPLSPPTYRDKIKKRAFCAMHGKYNKVVVIIRWRSSRSINRCNTEKKSREWQNPMALNTLTKRLWRNRTDFFFFFLNSSKRLWNNIFLACEQIAIIIFHLLKLAAPPPTPRIYFLFFRSPNSLEIFAKIFFLCFRRFLGEVLCLWWSWYKDKVSTSIVRFEDE